jgi:signal transduction histidine kinase
MSDPPPPHGGRADAAGLPIIETVDPPPTSTLARFLIRRAGDLSDRLARQSLLVASVCLVTDVAALLTAGPVSQFRALDWGALVVLTLADAALALPARLSGWVALAHAGVRFAAGLLSGSIVGGHLDDAGALIAGYRAGAWLRGAAAYLALAVLVIGVGAGNLLSVHHGEVPLVEVGRSALLPWLVGRYTTARRAHIAELERLAEIQRRDARAAIDHAVAEERRSIARDLHDVISHHVSAIGIHAGAARLRLTDAHRPDGIADALGAVEMSSRSAMVDLRRLLDLLHGDAPDASRQPGLDNLEDLLDGVRRAGLPVRLATHGVARPVPGSLDIALYRIAQEMLTNALRHGDGSVVEIDLCYGDDSVSVSARNGIRAAVPHPPAGEQSARGLAGLRTRAAMFNGTVAYGPSSTGHRWETTATFPLGGDR